MANQKCWLPHEEFSHIEVKDKRKAGTDDDDDEPEAKRPALGWDPFPMDEKTLRGLSDSVLAEIAAHLTDAQLAQLCLVRKELNAALCGNDTFWSKRLKQRASRFVSEDGTQFASNEVKAEVTADADFPWKSYYMILVTAGALEFTDMLLGLQRALRERLNTSLHVLLQMQHAIGSPNWHDFGDAKDRDDLVESLLEEVVSTLSIEAYDAVSTPNFIVNTLFGPHARHQKLFHGKMFQIAMRNNAPLAIHIDKKYDVLAVVARYLRSDKLLFGHNGLANVAAEVVSAESVAMLSYLIPRMDGVHWTIHAIAFAYHDGHENFAGIVGQMYSEYRYSVGYRAGQSASCSH